MQTKHLVIAGSFAAIIIAASVISAGFVTIMGMGAGESMSASSNESSYGAESESSSDSDVSCKVATLRLVGTISPFGTDSGYEVGEAYVDTSSVLDALDFIKQSKDYKAILLEINSGGGSPAAGEAIMKSLNGSTIPVYVLGYDMIASAAYYLSLAADKIYAHQMTEIGSIGVTSSFLTQVDKNRKEGYSYNEISSGPYKDIGTTNRAMTEEERLWTQTQVNRMASVFEGAVKARRSLTDTEINKLSDGRTWLANIALENKLIDGIGTRDSVLSEIAKAVGETKCEMEVLDLD